MSQEHFFPPSLLHPPAQPKPQSYLSPSNTEIKPLGFPGNGPLLMARRTAVTGPRPRNGGAAPRPRRGRQGRGPSGSAPVPRPRHGHGNGGGRRSGPPSCCRPAQAARPGLERVKAVRNERSSSF